MKIVTADQMRDLEAGAARLGITADRLMERAGLEVAREVRKLARPLAGAGVVVLVGPGNNGGDGLVAARHLAAWGARVSLFLAAPRPAGDDNLRRALAAGARSLDEPESLREALGRAEIVLDALLGTGKLRPLEGKLREALGLVQAAKARPAGGGLLVVALDLPSGLDATSGAVDPACLGADVTVTLGYPKLGLFAFPGAEHVGRLVTVDIGLPPELGQDIPSETYRLELVTPSLARSLLPARPLNAHKGSFGRVLAVCGSINYLGAPYLAASGALRVGAGLVTLALPRSLLPILAAKLTEATFLPLPEAPPGYFSPEAAPLVRERLAEYDVLLLGCGLGQAAPVGEFLRALLPLPPRCIGVVVDADGLNHLAATPEWWRAISGKAILTPHPGEMARLAGLSTGEVQSRRLEVARGSAARWGKVVVLKGAYTVIGEPGGQARIGPWANPGLASAGTGDVLAGAIAGLLAQGLAPWAAATLGVYLHGAAGELVRNEFGPAGMTASDLLPRLPRAVEALRESR